MRTIDCLQRCHVPPHQPKTKSTIFANLRGRLLRFHGKVSLKTKINLSESDWNLIY